EDLRLRRGRAKQVADLGARLAPQEEVDQSHVRLRPLRERESLVAVRGGQAELHPRLALEQDAEAPLDDVVVVDDEHTKLEGLIVHRCGATKRTCQRSPGSGPNSTSPAR